MDISDKIKVVLVETSHPGNIGSVARAMKTMGFKDLLLVDPKCEINSLSYAMASSAKDILKNSLKKLLISFAKPPPCSGESSE